MTDLTATGLPLDNTADTAAEQYDPAHDHHALNAMLNLYDADGKIQFDKDKAAEREYVTGHVATNSKRFASTAERLEYLISNQYYNPASWCASKTTWSRFRAASTRPSSSPSAAVAWPCC